MARILCPNVTFGAFWIDAVTVAVALPRESLVRLILCWDSEFNIIYLYLNLYICPKKKKFIYIYLILYY